MVRSSAIDVPKTASAFPANITVAMQDIVDDHYSGSPASNAILEQGTSLLDSYNNKSNNDDDDDDDENNPPHYDDDDDDDDDDHKERAVQEKESGRYQVVIEFSAGCKKLPIGPSNSIAGSVSSVSSGEEEQEGKGGEGEDKGENIQTKERSSSAIQSTVADTLNGEISINTWRNEEDKVEKLEILHTTSLENFEDMLQNLLSKVKYATMADEWNVRRVKRPATQAWSPISSRQQSKHSPFRPGKISSSSGSTTSRPASRNASRPASPLL
jgi:hypothetical protein